MNDFITRFKNEMRHNGLQPPETLIPGKYHRIPGVNKGPNNRSGWCCLLEDGSAGHFGDWSSDLKGYLRADSHKQYTRHEQAEHARKLRAARAQAEQERLTKQRAAANRAFSLFLSADRADESHPYLLRKGIERHGALTHQRSLLLPITSFAGFVASVQFIAEDGTKKLLTDGRKKGCFIHVSGDLLMHDQIIICEGWATGCTLATYHPSALVLAAIDAGNLKAVAINARSKWPSAEIVIAGDDDQLNPHNPGKAYATEAAQAADALLAFPQWPTNAPKHLSDFNDLDVWLKRGEV